MLSRPMYSLPSTTGNLSQGYRLRRGQSNHQRLTDLTLFTEVGQVVGTLEYMAPEQAELNNLDIDSRADIYALGIFCMSC